MSLEQIASTHASMRGIDSSIKKVGQKITQAKLFLEVVSAPTDLSATPVDALQKVVFGDRPLKLNRFDISPDLPWEERLPNLLRVATAKKNIAQKALPRFAEDSTQLKVQKRALGLKLRELKAQIHADPQEFLDGYYKVEEAVEKGFIDKSELEWMEAVARSLKVELPKVEEPTPIEIIRLKIEPSLTPSLDSIINELGHSGPKFRAFLASPKMAYMAQCMADYCTEVGIDNIDQEGFEKYRIGFIFQSVVEQEIRPLLSPRTKAPFAQIDSDKTLDLWKLGFPKRKVLKHFGGLGLGMEKTYLPDGLVLFPNGEHNSAIFAALYEISLTSRPATSGTGKENQFEAISQGNIEDDLRRILDLTMHNNVDPNYENGIRELLKDEVGPNKAIAVRPETRFSRFYIIPRQGNTRKGQRKPKIAGVEFVESTFYTDEIRKVTEKLWEDAEFQFRSLGKICPESFAKLNCK